MSGGSYDYLGVSFDLDDLLMKRSQLESMRDRLIGLGYAPDAASETDHLICMLNQWEVLAATRIKRLSPIWFAIEWWDSGDHGEAQVKEAISKYRKEDEVN